MILSVHENDVMSFPVWCIKPLETFLTVTSFLCNIMFSPLHLLSPSQAPSSISPLPPPSPMHRRSAVPLAQVRDDDDAVAETADSSVIIRMTPHQEGEELLTVEVKPREEEEGVEVAEK